MKQITHYLRPYCIYDVDKTGQTYHVISATHNTEVILWNNKMAVVCLRVFTSDRRWTRLWKTHTVRYLTYTNNNRTLLTWLRSSEESEVQPQATAGSVTNSPYDSVTFVLPKFRNACAGSEVRTPLWEAEISYDDTVSLTSLMTPVRICSIRSSFLCIQHHFWSCLSFFSHSDHLYSKQIRNGRSLKFNNESQDY